ncbi:MAG: cupin domain-containing protein [Deltaproteobacteria bacterium]|nr:cupin domain-containing protein [Deltaproteobacteria bacterium]
MAQTLNRQATEIISQLGLQPHPEGGWYRETWRAAAEPGQRGHATAIYYLLQRGERSHWHRVDATEIWHFHAGDPLQLQTWDGEGPPQTLRLGGDPLRGQVPQLVIPPGHWQAAAPLGAWTLVSCTVAPAFVFQGFEMAAPGWQPPDLSARVEAGVGPLAEDAALGASRHLRLSDVQLDWHWRSAERRVEGQLQFGPAAEGLPGHVHGGLLAALCDEAMGWACWCEGHIAPGAQIHSQFLAPAPSDRPLDLRAELVGSDGRSLYLAATVTAADQPVLLARGVYVSIKPKDLTPFAAWPGRDRWPG